MKSSAFSSQRLNKCSLRDSRGGSEDQWGKELEEDEERDDLDGLLKALMTKSSVVDEDENCSDKLQIAQDTYELTVLAYAVWLSFNGKWGEWGTDEANAADELNLALQKKRGEPTDSV